MVKHFLKSLLRFFGVEVSRYRKPLKSVRTKRLTFHDTKTGKYYLPTDAHEDIVANAIIRNEVFEQEVIDCARDFVTPHTSVLDVGANFGQMSILFSSMVGSNGKVYSFDADDFVFEILKKNISANGLENIVPVFGAVHNVAGTTLRFPEQDFKERGAYGAYGIDYNATSGREVKTLTIDSLKIKERISFMKIDIQGGDLFAMQGAVKTIRRNKMPIVFEYEALLQDEFRFTFQDYIDFVQKIEYRFDKVISGHNYLILPEGRQHVINVPARKNRGR